MSQEAGTYSRAGLDHCGYCDRCTTAASPAQARSTQSGTGHWPYGRDSRGWVGRSFPGFSTARTGSADSTGVASVLMLSDERIDPIYEATVQATEEAIIN